MEEEIDTYDTQAPHWCLADRGYAAVRFSMGARVVTRAHTPHDTTQQSPRQQLWRRYEVVSTPPPPRGIGFPHTYWHTPKECE